MNKRKLRPMNYSRNPLRKILMDGLSTLQGKLGISKTYLGASVYGDF